MRSHCQGPQLRRVDLRGVHVQSLEEPHGGTPGGEEDGDEEPPAPAALHEAERGEGEDGGLGVNSTALLKFQ